MSNKKNFYMGKGISKDEMESVLIKEGHLKKDLERKKLAEENFKRAIDETTYSEEELEFVKTKITPIGNNIIIKPTIIISKGNIQVEPSISPIAEVLAVGLECKYLKKGDKVWLNFATIGNSPFYQISVNNKKYMCLMENQISFSYPSDVKTYEEDEMDNPELKPDDGLAFTTEKAIIN